MNIVILAIAVEFHELLDLRFNSRLQHPVGPRANQFIERAGLAKMGSILQHF
jgi:hypothetical protein